MRIKQYYGKEVILCLCLYLIMAAISCTDRGEDKVVIWEYRIINDSSVPVKLELYNRETARLLDQANIATSDSTSFIQTDEDTIIYPFGAFVDSVAVIFDDGSEKKVLSYAGDPAVVGFNGTERSILNFASYEVVKKGSFEVPEVLRYAITKEDYQNALPIGD